MRSIGVRVMRTSAIGEDREEWGDWEDGGSTVRDVSRGKVLGCHQRERFVHRPAGYQYKHGSSNNRPWISVSRATEVGVRQQETGARPAKG